MVLYALALAVLPLALAGSIYPQQQMQAQFPQEKNWGWGVQMQGSMVPQQQMNQQQMMQQQMYQQMNQQQMQQQQQQQGSQQWWSASNSEEYEAYLKWCEERKLAMQEQEQQEALLKEMEAKATEAVREKEREKAAHEMQMRRESLANQWNMWKSQLEMADDFDGKLSKYEDKKTHYMFELTMEFLHFCKCSDYATHLQRYLVYGKDGYEAEGFSDVFTLEGLEGIDANDVNAVAQRVITLPQTEQVKLFYGGAVNSMCEGMKAYLQQVIAWEAQYNFMN